MLGSLAPWGESFSSFEPELASHGFLFGLCGLSKSSLAMDAERLFSHFHSMVEGCGVAEGQLKVSCGVVCLEAL